MSGVDVLAVLARLEDQMILAERAGVLMPISSVLAVRSALAELIAKAKPILAAQRVEWEPGAPATFEVAESDMEAFRAALARCGGAA